MVDSICNSVDSFRSFFIGTIFIPESPRFWFTKVKLKSKVNLSQLRSIPTDHPYSVYEMENIIKDVEDKKLKLANDGFLHLF